MFKFRDEFVAVRGLEAAGCRDQEVEGKMKEALQQVETLAQHQGILVEVLEGCSRKQLLHFIAYGILKSSVAICDATDKHPIVFSNLSPLLSPLQPSEPVRSNRARRFLHSHACQSNTENSYVETGLGIVISVHWLCLSL